MKRIKLTTGMLTAGLSTALLLAGCTRQEEAQPQQQQAQPQQEQQKPSTDNELTSTTEAKPYPLDTCLVCGMKLSGMSKSRSFVYQGQEIKVCDSSEEEVFNKDPDKYVKQLAEAETKVQNL